MSEGVFTNDLRVAFVQKSPSEVGTGTPFPMIVPGATARLKFNKLAELLTRVKRSKFSGSITADYSFAALTLAFTSSDPPADNWSGTDADVIVQQAYAGTETPPENVTQESRIWRGPLSSPTTATGLSYWSASHGLITGATQYAESFAVSSGYYPYGDDSSTEYRAAVELAFSGQIAWVDVNMSGNILDPLNEIYVGMNFFAFSWDLVKLAGGPDGPAMIFVDAYSEALGNLNEGEIGNLTFALSTGDLTCPIWLSNQVTLTSYASDITITPIEWWPYAKNAPSVPVWNTTTGAKL